jgi:hypothetical protein
MKVWNGAQTIFRVEAWRILILFGLEVRRPSLPDVSFGTGGLQSWAKIADLTEHKRISVFLLFH